MNEKKNKKQMIELYGIIDGRREDKYDDVAPKILYKDYDKVCRILFRQLGKSYIYYINKVWNIKNEKNKIDNINNMKRMIPKIRINSESDIESDIESGSDLDRIYEILCDIEDEKLQIKVLQNNKFFNEYIENLVDIFILYI